MVCANEGPTISVAAGVGLVMVTLRSAVRCNVVKIALVLFPGTGSMTVAEPMVAESCLVLSCAALAAKAALGKLPVMAMLFGLLATVKLTKAKLSPAGSQVVTPGAAAQFTPDTKNPAGNEFATLTLVASLGPALDKVSV